MGPVTGRWLKTDLFEEISPHRCLLPSLPEATWTAIDVSPDVARRARAHVLGDATASDVRTLPFRSGSFDGVLSTSTLDHFDDAAHIDASLRELRRVLRPGGRLFLTLDNPTNPLIRLRNALSPSTQRRTGLVGFPVGATLGRRQGVAALEAARFDVEATSFLLHAPHIVGTRLAKSARWERVGLPALDRLATTPLAPVTGHFVAFSAIAT